MRKSDEARIEKMFSGTNKVKPVRNARKIAEDLRLSRREVMAFLESRGLRRYSEGSYS